MMLEPQDPNRDLKLGLSLVASGAIALSPLALPNHPIAKIIPSGLGLAGSICSIAKANIYEHQDRIEADAKERWQALKADMDDALLVSSQAFYTSNPGAWLQRRPVPEVWHEQYLNARFSPLPELPAPQYAPITQPQPQPQTIQPGQTRGGSFDRAAASESPGTGWGDYEPRPQPPIAQTPTFSAQHQSFSFTRQTPDAWLNELVNYPSVLVFGAPGSGKTTFAEEIIRRRSSHQIIAIDPHYQPGKWDGAEIVGAGFDYPAITAFMLDLLDIVQERYRAYSQGVTQFPPITIVAEELTNWSSRVGGSEKLIELIPDARKIGLHFLFVAHDRTITALGGKSGLRKMLDATLCEVELLVKADSSGVQPAMKARLKMPNQAVREVSVPRFTTVATTPPIQTPEPHTPPSFEPDFSPVVQGSGFTVQTSEPTLNALPPASEPPLDREGELLTQFAEFKALGMNKAQICFALFGAKKGGTNAYKMASDFYDRLNSKYSQTSGDDAA